MPVIRREERRDRAAGLRSLTGKLDDEANPQKARPFCEETGDLAKASHSLELGCPTTFIRSKLLMLRTERDIPLTRLPAVKESLKTKKAPRSRIGSLGIK
jgi:hypothetical protein